MTDTQSNQLSALYNQLVLHEGDKVLLWTNSSPTNSFAAQTITISTLSSYRYCIISILSTTSDTTRDFDKLGNRLFTIPWSYSTTNIVASNYQYTRIITSISSSSIVFGGGNSPVYSATDTYGIPMYIYGI